LPGQAAGFYSQLGRCRRANGQAQSARLLIERSMALRRGAEGGAVELIENRVDLAGLHADSGQTGQALDEFAAARDALHIEAGDRHPLLIDIGRDLAALHLSQGRSAIAEREMRGALAIALEARGAQHPVTQAVRRELASVLIRQGHLDEAHAQMAARHDGLVARLGAGHADLRTSHAALGHLGWERGRLVDALRGRRAALALSTRGGNPLQIGADQVALAEVLLGSGRADEALVLLQQARERLPRQPPQKSTAAITSDIERLLGEAFQALQRPAAAAAHFGDALELARGSGDPTRTRLAEFALARHQARNGDPAGLARLDALAALPAALPAQRIVTWRARAAAAQARCSGAGLASAQRTLDGLIMTLRIQQPGGGALARELSDIRAACDTPTRLAAQRRAAQL